VPVFNYAYTGAADTKLGNVTGWTFANASSGATSGARINASNQLKGSTSSANNWDLIIVDGLAYEPGSTNYYCKQAIFATSNVQLPLCVAVTADGNSGLGLRLSSASTIELYRWTAFEGSLTLVASASYTYSSGAVAELRWDAGTNSYSVIYNGSSIAALSGTYVGLTGDNVGLCARGGTALDPWADDWESGPLAVAVPGTIAMTFGLSASLTGIQSAAGSIPIAFGVSGTATGAGAVAGSAAAAFAVSGVAAGSAAAGGTSAMAFAGTGSVINAAVGIAGTAGVSFGAVAAIAAIGTVAGTAAAAFGASGHVCMPASIWTGAVLAAATWTPQVATGTWAMLPVATPNWSSVGLPWPGCAPSS
jgi:hypothetical protein